eukprot:CAMPEP_0182877188 /NCGR_PEP_ID=MMETSP0034_2-20130328/14602_1 /TAXON_ID=156128 /ORGANISM="Nephroselmis pyriformis, Strain CCMP717" /LENGTH=107 /DNA_ID=CAMNT_0025010017 /DNA_START=73 /DNA_END=392 /DNA_ORIENTATION=+
MAKPAWISLLEPSPVQILLVCPRPAALAARLLPRPRAHWAYHLPPRFHISCAGAQPPSAARPRPLSPRAQLPRREDVKPRRGLWAPATAKAGPRGAGQSWQIHHPLP